MSQNTLKILYINPEMQLNNKMFPVSILRLSNFLTSKAHLIDKTIEQQYLDIRCENLPQFSPDQLPSYRKMLQKVLSDTYNDFNFDLVAISCFSSFQYLNSVEVALMVKSHINPECQTIIGGIHPSVLPEDFHPDNIPNYFYDYYLSNEVPFNYLIIGEAELGFYELIRKLSQKEMTSKLNQYREISSNFLTDLTKLPIIDFSLYEKYKQDINNSKYIFLDFSRGCIFRCTFCILSSSNLPCLRKLRMKPITNCIEELKVIKNTPWLDIERVGIFDPIFFPKYSYRNSFYESLKNLKTDEFPYKIGIYDRIDLCSKNDLLHYKELDIIPAFGLDSISKSILISMNKINSDDGKGYTHYLDKFKEIAQYSNTIDSEIHFNYIIGFPGFTKKHFKEFDGFFFNPQSNKTGLMDKFKINLGLCFFKVNAKMKIVEECEQRFGSHIYFKQWWRLFQENYVRYGFLLNPSKELILREYIEESSKCIENLFSHQIMRGNEYYTDEQKSYYTKALDWFRKAEKTITRPQ